MVLGCLYFLFFTGFGFAVGNALKFTHKGSVSVHVKVAAEQIVKPPIDTDDGNNGEFLVYFMLCSAMPFKIFISKPLLLWVFFRSKQQSGREI